MLPQDALVLAVTKLRTRRIRLFVTVIIAGLLFVLLTSASIVVNGVINSVEDFSEEGLGKRFIVRVNPAGGDSTFELFSNPEVIAEVKARSEQIEQQKKAKAKELGIPYDESSSLAVTEEYGPGGDEMIIDPSTPAAAPIIERFVREESASFYETLSAVADEYNATDRYNSVSLLNFAFGPSLNTTTTISVIKDGKERSNNGSTNSFNGPPRGIESITYGLEAFSDKLVTQFVIDGENLDVRDGSIPVIVPYSAAEEILNLQALPAQASSTTRLERIQDVRQNIAGQTFQLCLRNQESINRQNEAEQHQQQLKLNEKDPRKHPKPELVYSRSEQPCEDVVVTRDVRSSFTIRQDETQLEFDRTFGSLPPSQRLITMRVVGIAADPPDFASFKITDIINSLLVTNLTSGWLLPLSAQNALPEFQAQFDNVNNSSEYSVGNYLEFSEADDARKIINEKSCTLDFTYLINDVPAGPGHFQESCEQAGTPFFINPFGSSSIALEDFRSSFSSGFSRALLIVAAISMLIMMGTIGKIISDSRRETAVFRAIGAKRLDIAQIYVTYAFLIGLFVSIFALILGYATALFIDSRYSTDFTVEALVAFNASDTSRTFSLIGIDRIHITMLLGIILAGSMISATIPLLSNVRRNPIKDMRDER